MYSTCSTLNDLVKIQHLFYAQRTEGAITKGISVLPERSRMKNMSQLQSCEKHGYLLMFFIIGALQCISGGVIERARRELPKTDEMRLQVEAEARADTAALLNGLFRAQINFFGKVKQSLGPQTQRVRDIETYTTRLNQVIAVEDIHQKDQMWLETFKEFNKSPLLLNKESETGVSNEEYERILADNGLQDVIKSFLADVAAYFWKMAKASGKVVEVAVDEYIQTKRESLMSLSRRFNLLSLQ